MFSLDFLILGKILPTFQEARIFDTLISNVCFSDASKEPLLTAEESAEQDVLKSELWTTLFRGGFMIGKLQQSLSGKYVSGFMIGWQICKWLYDWLANM